MGTTLACIQIYLGDKPKAATHGAVVEGVRQHILRSGLFVETISQDDHDADRIVSIGPTDNSWLTLHDSQGNLRELARNLSQVIDGTVIFISLIDSDVIHLRQYMRGAIIDDYCNAPDLYDSYGNDPDWQTDWGELGNSKLQALKSGDVQKWHHLLVESADLDALQQLWTSPRLFADDIVWAMVEAAGMNADEIWSVSQPGTEGFTRLTFRLAAPRQYETKAEGPPKLELASAGYPTQVSAGDAAELMMSVRNDGGAATGWDIIAWGSSLDQGFVNLRQVQLFRLIDRSDLVTASFVARQGDFGDRVQDFYIAAFDLYELPAGIAGGSQATVQPGVDWQKAYDALRQAEIHVTLLGSFETPGTGELFVAFVPHANRSDGHTGYHLALEVLPTPRRPLRYSETRRQIDSVHLQSLKSAAQRVAVVALNAGRVESGAIAAGLIEAWIAQSARRTTGSLAIYLRAQLELHAEQRDLPAVDIPDSERWQELRQALATCVSFEIADSAEKFVLDANPLSLQSSGEALAPHLGIFHDLMTSPETETAALMVWLAETIDALMAKDLVLQALIAPWKWQTADSLDMTPYELATGISGQCTRARFWCQRYLRGVSHHLWLGPELLSHLGGIEQLVPLAEVTPLGHGVRVKLRPEASLDDLEQALAPIIPSEQDWFAGWERIYPRHKRQHDS